MRYTETPLEIWDDYMQRDRKYGAITVFVVILIVVVWFVLTVITRKVVFLGGLSETPPECEKYVDFIVGSFLTCFGIAAIRDLCFFLVDHISLFLNIYLHLNYKWATVVVLACPFVLLREFVQIAEAKEHKSKGDVAKRCYDSQKKAIEREKEKIAEYEKEINELKAALANEKGGEF